MGTRWDALITAKLPKRASNHKKAISKFSKRWKQNSILSSSSKKLSSLKNQRCSRKDCVVELDEVRLPHCFCVWYTSTDKEIQRKTRFEVPRKPQCRLNRNENKHILEIRFFTLLYIILHHNFYADSSIAFDSFPRIHHLSLISLIADRIKILKRPGIAQLKRFHSDCREWTFPRQAWH